MEAKISREIAEQEFADYCESNEIDIDETTMDERDKKTFEPIKKRFLKACMAGRVAVDGCKIEYVVSAFSKSSGEKLIVCRPTGKAFVSPATKNGNNFLMINAMLSNMTGKDVSYFATLDTEDVLFLSGLVSLFLSA